MKLKEYLDVSGVRQKFLADKAAISYNSLNAYVLGKKMPTISTAWKIEQATDGKVTIYDWLDEETNIDGDTCIQEKCHKNSKNSPSKKAI